MHGTVVSGEREAAAFVGATADALAEVVGFRPFHGTLNLADAAGLDDLPSRTIDDDLGDERCDGIRLRSCSVGGVRSAVIRPLVPGYPESKVELLAPVRLRTLFGFEDGDAVPVSLPDDPWSPEGPVVASPSLDLFEAVVFDLDGTLVDLAVDWPAVHDEIDGIVGPYLDRPIREYGRNGLFRLAEEHGVYDELVALVETRERDGADEAAALLPIGTVEELSRPVGICTANATSAAETALERFGVRDAVDVVVARESTREGKPHPGPLVACFDRLGVAPGDAVFVGNEPSDAEAAARAGASFLHVDQLRPDR